MHKGPIRRGMKMMKKPPEPGLPPPAPRPMSRSKPGTTPMKKDGPMSDNSPNQTIAQAVEAAEFSFLPEAPKPFIPPQDQWPAEPPITERLRAHAPSRKAYRALRKV